MHFLAFGFERYWLPDRVEFLANTTLAGDWDSRQTIPDILQQVAVDLPSGACLGIVRGWQMVVERTGSGLPPALNQAQEHTGLREEHMAGPVRAGSEAWEICLRGELPSPLHLCARRKDHEAAARQPPSAGREALTYDATRDVQLWMISISPDRISPPPHPAGSFYSLIEVSPTWEVLTILPLGEPLYPGALGKDNELKEFIAVDGKLVLRVFHPLLLCGSNLWLSPRHLMLNYLIDPATGAVALTAKTDGGQ